MITVSQFVRSLIGLCEHRWKEVERFEIGFKSRVDGRLIRTGTRVECTCQRCGIPRKFDLR